MTQIQPVIRTMTWEETQEFGLYHQGLMMEYECVTYRLQAGTTDSLHVFKSGVTLFVLTINTHLDYIGLDAYMSNEPDPVDSIFLQGSYAIEECIGTDWRSMSIAELVIRLIQDFA